jgi:hypothetical protein
MARLHAFDSVAIFVHVEEAGTHRKTIKAFTRISQGAWKGFGVKCVAHPTKPLPAPHVMYAVHKSFLKSLHADHGIARDDCGEFFF